jgi:hypothetical protein
MRPGPPGTSMISGVRATKTSLLWISIVLRVFAILSLIDYAAPLAQGQVNFSTPPTYSGGGTVFVADFNGDGKPDILTADGTLNLGNGDGTFRTGTPVSGQPLAVADFNGDGRQDVLEQAQGTLQVLLGNGDGTFQPPIITNIGVTLTAVVATDLNGDGKADVAGVFNNELLVYINNGGGTFAAGVPYNLGTFQGLPTLMVFGDFNGDHKTDAAVLTEGAPGQVIVLLGNGDGTFQSTPLISPGIDGPIAVVVRDFNGDLKLDLAISEVLNNGNVQVATVFLQLGNGDGTFQAPTTAFNGPYSGEGANGFENTALAAAGVNGDGKLDLVFAADLIGIYLGNGDGTFSNTPNYYQPMASGSSTGIAIADFNLDGKLDVAADGEILLGNGNGTLQGPPTVLLPSSADVAAVGKFIKTGAPGVAAISSGTTNSLYILTNDGSGILSLANTYPLQQPSYAIAAADVNGDGNLDLIVTGADPNSHNWSYSVLLGNGDGSFQSPTLYQQNVQAVPSMIVIADFNNDGKPDFALPVGNSVAVLLGNGDGTFGTPTLFFDGEADSIVSADFNGDGKLDIAAGGASGLAILLGNGSGTFQPAAFPYTTGLDVVATADLNGDGKADIVANGNGIQILLGNGDGTFNALAPFGSGNAAIALADVNGDGNVDVIAEEALGSTVHNGILLGNGDGTFDSSEIFIPYNYPPHFQFPVVQTADMNGDGKPDLIIESPVSTAFVLLNSTPPVPGTRFSPTSVTFPSQVVGTSSNSAPVILTNPGTVALTVTSVTLSGANAGEFKQTNNCTTVQPLANCTIKVMFAPTAAGGLSANLVIVDDAFSGSQQIAVSGTAVVPGFSLSAAALSPASVSTGGSATTTIAVASVGGFNQTVTLACGSIMLNGSLATTDPPTCKFSPPSVNSASGTSTLTINTTGPSAALVPVFTRSHGLFYAMLLPILGIAVIGAGFSSRPKKLVGTSLACLMISGLLFLAACGGGNSGVGGGTSTPAGTYTISISGSAGSVVEKPITVTLIVQ